MTYRYHVAKPPEGQCAALTECQHCGSCIRGLHLHLVVPGLAPNAELIAGLESDLRTSPEGHPQIPLIRQALDELRATPPSDKPGEVGVCSEGCAIAYAAERGWLPEQEGAE